MRLPLLAAAAIILAACTRYEYRQGSCPEPPPPGSAIGWQRTSGSGGAIEGRVVTIDSVKPIQLAMVTLSGDTRRWGTTAEGRFRLDSVTPGNYVLTVRRIGFSPATQAITVSTDSAVTALVALQRMNVILDGCGYVAIRVKKPWWKFW
jgi:predicted phage tail protein